MSFTNLTLTHKDSTNGLKEVLKTSIVTSFEKIEAIDTVSCSKYGNYAACYSHAIKLCSNETSRSENEKCMIKKMEDFG